MATVVRISPILVTLMMEALVSSVTSALIRATRRNILEDAILHEWSTSETCRFNRYGRASDTNRTAH
jgi:hypothetical protein